MAINKQKKFYFLPLPAYGHINPTLNVMRELHERGHQVICYALDEFKPLIEATGAVYREYTHGKIYDTSISRNVGYLGVILGKIAEDLLPNLLHDIETDPPDCIVHDATAIFGKIAAQKYGILAVSLCCTLAYHDQLFLRYPRLFAKTLRKSGTNTFGAIKKHISLYKKYNFKPAAANDIFSNKEPLNIVFTSSSYHPLAEKFDSTFLFVGPSIAPRNDSDPVTYEKNKKIIYISLGTVINDDKLFYAKLIDIFANTNYSAIISLGKRFSPEDFSSVPHNIQLKKYVNQLKVLQHTDLFITHAGLNGVNEGLYYGVPMVLIPDTEEQTVLAHRVQELKAGILLQKNRLTKEKLETAIEKILHDEKYYVHAQLLQKSLRAAGGYKKAADEILHYLQNSENK